MTSYSLVSAGSDINFSFCPACSCQCQSKKRCCCEFYDKMFYPPLTLTEVSIRRRFQLEQSTSVYWQVCHWAQRRQQHEAPSVLHFSSFFWGRSFAVLWQRPQIRKWLSIVDSRHSPIHAPGCSVDYKKSCVRSFIFYLLSPNSFLITFHTSLMCVRLPVWDPLTAHCASENVTC